MVQNAIKYTFKGSIKLKIDFEEEPRLLKICVEDTGIGIKPKIVRKLQQHLKNIDLNQKMEKKSAGCGLGLAMSSFWTTYLCPNK